MTAKQRMLPRKHFDWEFARGGTVKVSTAECTPWLQLPQQRRQGLLLRSACVEFCKIVNNTQYGKQYVGFITPTLGADRCVDQRMTASRPASSVRNLLSPAYLRDILEHSVSQLVFDTTAGGRRPG